MGRRHGHRTAKVKGRPITGDLFTFGRVGPGSFTLTVARGDYFARSRWRPGVPPVICFG
jgi:hypothetical protein